MSIFKTTLKVESTNSSSAPVNFTTSVNNDLTDNIVFGKIIVNSVTDTDVHPEGTGAEGSYLYIKSSSTNPNYTAINIISKENSEGIATLYAGECALIPLSKGISQLVATTTHGTAELEYFFGSRGAEVGENELIWWRNTDTTTYWYTTIDAATGVHGPINNTGINYDSWVNDQIDTIVNRKGYIFRFYDNDGTYKFVFIGSDGEIIQSLNLDSNSVSTYWGDGRANILMYPGSGNTYYVTYFDGDNVYTNTFDDVVGDIYLDDNWDECTADGSFPIYISGYNGNGDIEAIVLVKGEDKTLIKTTDYGDTSLYMNAYVYSHGNFIAIESIYDDGYLLKNVEIFSTDGTLLKSVDYNELPLDETDYYFYGSGKVQFVHTDRETGRKTFLNYNQLTGNIIGDDLQWVSDYDNYYVVCDNYRTGYGLNYKPESIAIIKYYADGWNPNYLLDTATDGDLEVTYIINNDLTARNYIVPNTEDDYFVSDAWNTRNYATENDFVLLSGDNRSSGPLVATRFASGTEPTKFNLIENLSSYRVSDVLADEWVTMNVFGDYRLIAPRPVANNGRDVIVYVGGKVLDKITTSYWDWFWDNEEYESLFIGDPNDSKYWYFNTSTKKFVLLPETYVWEDYNTYDEGDQAVVNPGKILLTTWKENTNSISFMGRMITRGAAGVQKELVKGGDSSNFEFDNIYVNMSTETVVVFYKEYYYSTWKVRVFDLNLNFLYEIDTQKPYQNGYDSYGKLNTVAFYDNDNNYTVYTFNKLLNSVDFHSTIGWNNAFNNSNWD